MNFHKDYIYHIYNQGNNRQKIFFERENYLFFLKKVKLYLSPYADILAWCLMPNHFHFMVLVREVEVSFEPDGSSHPITSHPMTRSHRMTSSKRSLNNSIAIMLRSYTRAINKQENTSGSLFRAKTKAQCINCPDGISLSWFTENGIVTGKLHPDFDYPKVCFDYIHLNPVKAGLVKSDIVWEFSSARDFSGLREGKLINIKVAAEYGLT